MLQFTVLSTPLRKFSLSPNNISKCVVFKHVPLSVSIGHYTALAWSNTNRVGCGLSEYRQGKWFAKLYTCNYGPSGNYIGGQMYEQGPACSSCQQGQSCSREFPGLCSGE